MIRMSLVFLFHFFLMAGMLYAKEQLVDRVVAVINDDVITQSEFELVFRPFYEQLKQEYQGAELKRYVEDARRKLLGQMIEDRLVYQEAMRLGIEVSASEVQSQVDLFKKQLKDPEQFEKEINSGGLSREALEKRMRERLAIEKVHANIIRGKVAVSPLEVDQYYNEHADEFTLQDQCQLWGITLRKSPAATDKGMMDEQAKQKARELLQLLEGGGDFETLAREHSEDNFRSKGGYLGYVQKGEMINSIEDAIFALQEHSYSGVLETTSAYHIFKVGERVSGHKMDVEAARDAVRDKLFRQKAHERFEIWMEEVKAKSHISIR